MLASEGGTASLRQLAERFECSKSQIGILLKNKAKILSQFEENVPITALHLKKKARVSK